MPHNFVPFAPGKCEPPHTAKGLFRSRAASSWRKLEIEKRHSNHKFHFRQSFVSPRASCADKGQ